MESEILLAHFKRSHHVILISLSSIFIIFSLVFGLIAPKQMKITSNESNDVTITSNTTEYRFQLPKIKLTQLDYIVAYYQKVYLPSQSSENNKNIPDRKTYELNVKYHEIDSNETIHQHFKLNCVYRNNSICGKVTLIDQKLYRKNDAEITIQVMNFEHQEGIKIEGNIGIVVSQENYSETIIIYSLVVFMCAFILFVFFIIIEYRFFIHKKYITSLQAMNTLLVIAVSVSTFPWVGLIYETQWFPTYSLSKISYSLFHIIFICYMFYMLDSFKKQNGTETTLISWVFRACMIFFFIVIRFTSTILHTYTMKKYLLVPFETQLYYTTEFIELTEKLVQFFLYCWAVYNIAMTYNRVTTPVVQKQLKYFAGYTLLFLFVLIFTLFMSNFLTETTAFVTYFEYGAMVLYLFAMLFAFLPSLSPVMNEWSIFYKEMNPADLYYDSDEL